MLPNKTLLFSGLLLTMYLVSKLTFMKPYPTGRVATKGQKSQKIFLLFSNNPKNNEIFYKFLPYSIKSGQIKK